MPSSNLDQPRTPGEEGVNQVFVFLAIAAVALVLRLVFFTGVLGSDDVFHAGGALRLLEQGFSVPEGHHGARFGLFLPVAPIFFFFGVGDWQMAIYPLVLDLLSIWLAWRLGTMFANARVGLLAAGCLAVFPLDIMEASRLSPDLPLGAMMALAIYLIMRADGSPNRIIWSICSGLAWGWAYLIKIEAGILGVVFLALFFTDMRKWFLPVAIAMFIAAGFVAVETLLYFMHTDIFLYRLKQIGGGSLMNEAYSLTQLSVFPKKWFVTIYLFGLHYYFLFAGLLWILFSRKSSMLVPMIWVVIFLIWLQFGFNPMVGFIGFKTKLARYCSMLTVPAMIVIAFLFDECLRRFSRWIPYSLIGAALFASVFFINFNQLNLEREVSTKKALALALKNNWFPLHLDAASHEFARFLWQGSKNVERIFSLQVHDFKAGKTQLTDLRSIDGYLLVNRMFMVHKNRRYSMEMVDLDLADEIGEIVATIDNPMPALAYRQAEFLSQLSRPLPSLHKRISTTVDDVLKGQDVVVYRLQSKK